jgi:hypothetical protein
MRNMKEILTVQRGRKGDAFGVVEFH